jgi:hypothetical protein
MEVRHLLALTSVVRRRWQRQKLREKGGGDGEIRRRWLEVRLRQLEIQQQLIGEDGGGLGEHGSNGRSSRFGGGSEEEAGGGAGEEEVGGVGDGHVQPAAALSKGVTGHNVG